MAQCYEQRATMMERVSDDDIVESCASGDAHGRFATLADHEAGYAAMAADTEKKAEAKEWATACMSRDDANEQARCMSKKYRGSVGIVIVTYNSSAAVGLTLDSLIRAKTEIFFNVIVIDNASSASERVSIRSDFDRNCALHTGEWFFQQSEKNLGFSGANNIGIQYFLEQEYITHICLLNSDVIVTDYWLDRLISKRLDIISPVTNRADSEQFVPVNYKLSLDCVTKRNSILNSETFEQINNFAQERYTIYSGAVIEAEPTFFCVLLSRELVKNVGFLDESFYPGGYEDDDYCIRAKGCGYKPRIARDVFIHHWGSASFSRIDFGYFSERAAENRRYLEKKHNRTWHVRPQSPFSSYRQDVFFLLEQGKRDDTALFFEKLFRSHLTAHMTALDSQHACFIAAAGATGSSATAHSALLPLWHGILKMVDENLKSAAPFDVKRSVLLNAFLDFEAKVLETVEAGIAHAVRQRNNAKCERPKVFLRSARDWLERLVLHFRTVSKGIRLLRFRRAIIFFGGYPYPDREKDGYFQRIAAIDRLFADHLRVHVDLHERSDCATRAYAHPEDSVLIFNYYGSKKRKVLITLCIILLAIWYRKVYFHSVLAMSNIWFRSLLRMPFIAGYIDIHGVVAEEFRYHYDFYSATIYEKIEEYAISHAKLIIVVTDAMGKYLRDKYRERLIGELLTLPIFPQLSTTTWKQETAVKPIVVYTGGLQKWQLAPRIVQAILCQSDKFIYKIYTPNPIIFSKLLPKHLIHCDSIVIDCLSHDELMDIYPYCHFGFILRDDIIVNHVACPTKLIEYIAMGIVPIVYCPDIGDFNNYGMQYVSIHDFEKGNIPNEDKRREMAIKNQKIYHKLLKIKNENVEKLLRIS
jgi:GT2 family glycosyltransferase